MSLYYAKVNKTSAELRLENLALRHQLGVLRRFAPKQLKLTPADRRLWVWLRRVWANWKSALLIVKPATVVARHRKGFRVTGKPDNGRRLHLLILNVQFADLVRTRHKGSQLIMKMERTDGREVAGLWRD